MSSQTIHDLFRIELNEDQLYNTFQEDLRDFDYTEGWISGPYDILSKLPFLENYREQIWSPHGSGPSEIWALKIALNERMSIRDWNNAQVNSYADLSWVKDAVKWRLVRGQVLKTALQRRALERGQNQVDLSQEHTGKLFTTYLDLETTRETYMMDLHEKPSRGAYLELLNYSLGVETLMDVTERKKGHKYPASLLKARILEAESWKIAEDVARSIIAKNNYSGTRNNHRDLIFMHDNTFGTVDLSPGDIGLGFHIDKTGENLLALLRPFSKFFRLRAVDEVRAFQNIFIKWRYGKMPVKLPTIMTGTLMVTPRGSPLIPDPVGRQLSTKAKQEIHSILQPLVVSEEQLNGELQTLFNREMEDWSNMQLFDQLLKWEDLRPALEQLNQGSETAAQIQEKVSIKECIKEGIKDDRPRVFNWIRSAIESKERIKGERQREFNWIRSTIEYRLLQGEQIKALLWRRALERGQTQVDLDQELEGEVFTEYLDVNPGSPTYRKCSDKKPSQGAYLELLQYRVLTDVLWGNDENALERERSKKALVHTLCQSSQGTLKGTSKEALKRTNCPASLLRANMIEYQVWNRLHEWLNEVEHSSIEYPRGELMIYDKDEFSGHRDDGYKFETLMGHFKDKAIEKVRFYLGDEETAATQGRDRRRIGVFFPKYVTGTLKVTRHG